MATPISVASCFIDIYTFISQLALPLRHQTGSVRSVVAHGDRPRTVRSRRESLFGRKQTYELDRIPEQDNGLDLDHIPEHYNSRRNLWARLTPLNRSSCLVLIVAVPVLLILLTATLYHYFHKPPEPTYLITSKKFCKHSLNDELPEVTSVRSGGENPGSEESSENVSEGTETVTSRMDTDGTEATRTVIETKKPVIETEKPVIETEGPGTEVKGIVTEPEDSDTKTEGSDIKPDVSGGKGEETGGKDEGSGGKAEGSGGKGEGSGGKGEESNAYKKHKPNAIEQFFENIIGNKIPPRPKDKIMERVEKISKSRENLRKSRMHENEGIENGEDNYRFGLRSRRKEITPIEEESKAENDIENKSEPNPKTLEISNKIPDSDFDNFMKMVDERIQNKRNKSEKITDQSTVNNTPDENIISSRKRREINKDDMVKVKKNSLGIEVSDFDSETVFDFELMSDDLDSLRTHERIKRDQNSFDPARNIIDDNPIKYGIDSKLDFAVLRDNVDTEYQRGILERSTMKIEENEIVSWDKEIQEKHMQNKFGNNKKKEKKKFKKDDFEMGKKREKRMIMKRESLESGEKKRIREDNLSDIKRANSESEMIESKSGKTVEKSKKFLLDSKLANVTTPLDLKSELSDSELVESKPGLKSNILDLNHKSTNPGKNLPDETNPNPELLESKSGISNPSLILKDIKSNDINSKTNQMEGDFKNEKLKEIVSGIDTNSKLANEKFPETDENLNRSSENLKKDSLFISKNQNFEIAQKSNEPNLDDSKPGLSNPGESKTGFSKSGNLNSGLSSSGDSSSNDPNSDHSPPPNSNPNDPNLEDSSPKNSRIIDYDFKIIDRKSKLMDDHSQLMERKFRILDDTSGIIDGNTKLMGRHLKIDNPKFRSVANARVFKNVKVMIHNPSGVDHKKVYQNIEIVKQISRKKDNFRVHEKMTEFSENMNKNFETKKENDDMRRTYQTYFKKTSHLKKNFDPNETIFENLQNNSRKYLDVQKMEQNHEKNLGKLNQSLESDDQTNGTKENSGDLEGVHQNPGNDAQNFPKNSQKSVNNQRSKRSCRCSKQTPPNSAPRSKRQNILDQMKNIGKFDPHTEIHTSRMKDEDYNMDLIKAFVSLKKQEYNTEAKSSDIEEKKTDLISRRNPTDSDVIITEKKRFNCGKPDHNCGSEHLTEVHDPDHLGHEHILGGHQHGEYAGYKPVKEVEKPMYEFNPMDERFGNPQKPNEEFNQYGSKRDSVSETHDTADAIVINNSGGTNPNTQNSGGYVKFGEYNQKTGEFNPKSGEYNPKNGEYNLKNGEYIPKNGEYIPKNGEYNPKNGEYSSKNGEYSSNSGGYNLNSGSYNPGGYNPSVGGYNLNYYGYNPYNQNFGYNSGGYNLGGYTSSGGYTVNIGFNSNSEGYSPIPGGYNSVTGRNPYASNYSNGGYNPVSNNRDNEQYNPVPHYRDYFPGGREYTPSGRESKSAEHYFGYESTPGAHDLGGSDGRESRRYDSMGQNFSKSFYDYKSQGTTKPIYNMPDFIFVNYSALDDIWNKSKGNEGKPEYISVHDHITGAHEHISGIHEKIGGGYDPIFPGHGGIKKSDEHKPQDPRLNFYYYDRKDKEKRSYKIPSKVIISEANEERSNSENSEEKNEKKEEKRLKRHDYSSEEEYNYNQEEKKEEIKSLKKDESGTKKDESKSGIRKTDSKDSKSLKKIESRKKSSVKKEDSKPNVKKHSKSNMNKEYKSVKKSSKASVKKIKSKSGGKKSYVDPDLIVSEEDIKEDYVEDDDEDDTKSVIKIKKDDVDNEEADTKRKPVRKNDETKPRKKKPKTKSKKPQKETPKKPKFEVLKEDFHPDVKTSKSALRDANFESDPTEDKFEIMEEDNSDSEIMKEETESTKNDPASGEKFTSQPTKDEYSIKKSDSESNDETAGKSEDSESKSDYKFGSTNDNNYKLRSKKYDQDVKENKKEERKENFYEEGSKSELEYETGIDENVTEKPKTKTDEKDQKTEENKIDSKTEVKEPQIDSKENILDIKADEKSKFTLKNIQSQQDDTTTKENVVKPKENEIIYSSLYRNEEKSKSELKETESLAGIKFPDLEEISRPIRSVPSGKNQNFIPKKNRPSSNDIEPPKITSDTCVCKKNKTNSNFSLIRSRSQLDPGDQIQFKINGEDILARLEKECSCKEQNGKNPGSEMKLDWNIESDRKNDKGVKLDWKTEKREVDEAMEELDNVANEIELGLKLDSLRRIKKEGEIRRGKEGLKRNEEVLEVKKNDCVCQQKGNVIVKRINLEPIKEETEGENIRVRFGNDSGLHFRTNFRQERGGERGGERDGERKENSEENRSKRKFLEGSTELCNCQNMKPEVVEEDEVRSKGDFSVPISDTEWSEISNLNWPELLSEAESQNLIGQNEAETFIHHFNPRKKRENIDYTKPFTLQNLTSNIQPTFLESLKNIYGESLKVTRNEGFREVFVKTDGQTQTIRPTILGQPIGKIDSKPPIISDETPLDDEYPKEHNHKVHKIHSAHSHSHNHKDHSHKDHVHKDHQHKGHHKDGHHHKDHKEDPKDKNDIKLPLNINHTRPISKQTVLDSFTKQRMIEIIKHPDFRNYLSTGINDYEKTDLSSVFNKSDFVNFIIKVAVQTIANLNKRDLSFQKVKKITSDDIRDYMSSITQGLKQNKNDLQIAKTNLISRIDKSLQHDIEQSESETSEEDNKVQRRTIVLGPKRKDIEKNMLPEKIVEFETMENDPEELSISEYQIADMSRYSNSDLNPFTGSEVIRMKRDSEDMENKTEITLKEKLNGTENGDKKDLDTHTSSEIEITNIFRTISSDDFINSPEVENSSAVTPEKNYKSLDEGPHMNDTKSKSINPASKDVLEESSESEESETKTVPKILKSGTENLETILKTDQPGTVSKPRGIDSKDLSKTLKEFSKSEESILKYADKILKSHTILNSDSDIFKPDNTLLKTEGSKSEDEFTKLGESLSKTEEVLSKLIKEKIILDIIGNKSQDSQLESSKSSQSNVLNQSNQLLNLLKTLEDSNTMIKNKKPIWTKESNGRFEIRSSKKSSTFDTAQEREYSEIKSDHSVKHSENRFKNSDFSDSDIKKEVMRRRESNVNVMFGDESEAFVNKNPSGTHLDKKESQASQNSYKKGKGIDGYDEESEANVNKDKSGYVKTKIEKSDSSLSIEGNPDDFRKKRSVGEMSKSENSYKEIRMNPGEFEDHELEHSLVIEDVKNDPILKIIKKASEDSINKESSQLSVDLGINPKEEDNFKLEASHVSVHKEGSNTSKFSSEPEYGVKSDFELKPNKNKWIESGIDKNPVNLTELLFKKKELDPDIKKFLAKKEHSFYNLGDEANIQLHQQPNISYRISLSEVNSDNSNLSLSYDNKTKSEEENSRSKRMEIPVKDFKIVLLDDTSEKPPSVQIRPNGITLRKLLQTKEEIPNDKEITLDFGLKKGSKIDAERMTLGFDLRKGTETGKDGISFNFGLNSGKPNNPQGNPQHETYGGVTEISFSYKSRDKDLKDQKPRTRSKCKTHKIDPETGRVYSEIDFDNCPEQNYDPNPLEIQPSFVEQDDGMPTSYQDDGVSIPEYVHPHPHYNIDSHLHHGELRHAHHHHDEQPQPDLEKPDQSSDYDLRKDDERKPERKIEPRLREPQSDYSLKPEKANFERPDNIPRTLISATKQFEPDRPHKHPEHPKKIISLPDPTELPLEELNYTEKNILKKEKPFYPTYKNKEKDSTYKEKDSAYKDADYKEKETEYKEKEIHKERISSHKDKEKESHRDSVYKETRYKERDSHKERDFTYKDRETQYKEKEPHKDLTKERDFAYKDRESQYKEKEPHKELTKEFAFKERELAHKEHNPEKEKTHKERNPIHKEHKEHKEHEHKEPPYPEKEPHKEREYQEKEPHKYQDYHKDKTHKERKQSNKELVDKERDRNFVAQKERYLTQKEEEQNLNAQNEKESKGKDVSIFLKGKDMASIQEPKGRDPFYAQKKYLTASDKMKHIAALEKVQQMNRHAEKNRYLSEKEREQPHRRIPMTSIDESSEDRKEIQKTGRSEKEKERKETGDGTDSYPRQKDIQNIQIGRHASQKGRISEAQKYLDAIKNKNEVQKERIQPTQERTSQHNRKETSQHNRIQTEKEQNERKKDEKEPNLQQKERNVQKERTSGQKERIVTHKGRDQKENDRISELTKKYLSRGYSLRTDLRSDPAMKYIEPEIKRKDHRDPDDNKDLQNRRKINGQIQKDDEKKLTGQKTTQKDIKTKNQNRGHESRGKIEKERKDIEGSRMKRDVDNFQDFKDLKIMDACYCPPVGNHVRADCPKITEANDYPTIGALNEIIFIDDPNDEYRYKCSGVVLNRNLFLTSEECVLNNKRQPKSYQITVGSMKLGSNNASYHRVEKFIFPKISNGLVLMKVSKHFPNIHTIEAVDLYFKREDTKYFDMLRWDASFLLPLELRSKHSILEKIPVFQERCDGCKGVCIREKNVQYQHSNYYFTSGHILLHNNNLYGIQLNARLSPDQRYVQRCFVDLSNLSVIKWINSAKFMYP